MKKIEGIEGMPQDYEDITAQSLLCQVQTHLQTLLVVTLTSCPLKPGPWINYRIITWGLVKYAESQVPSQTN